MKKIHREAEAKKRTRPSHSTVQNVIWMLHNAWKSCRTVPLWCVVLAALTVGLNLAELFAVPQILACLEDGTSLHRLLSRILLFSGLLLVLSFLKRYVEDLAQWRRIFVRFQIMAAINRKANYTSYPNALDPEKQNLRMKAYEMTSGNNKPSEQIWNTLTAFLANVGGFAIYTLMLIRVDPILLGIVLVTACIGFLAARWANAWQYANEDQTYWARQGYIQSRAESVQTAKDIRIFKMQGWLLGLLDHLTREYGLWAWRVEQHRLVSGGADVALGIVRNGFAYFYLIHMALRDGLPASEFLLYFSAVSGFSTWITNILNHAATLHKEALELNYIREYLSLAEPFRLEDGQAIPLAEGYELCLQDVSYRYPGAEADTLKKVNLTVRPGEKLAIVGLNGAGKTTLVKLLCGLLDPTEGSVLLNGQDIRIYNRPEYYRLFSSLFQDFSLLDVTIAENIAQSADMIDRDRVLECLRQAGLEEKIASLPGGIDAHVGRNVFEDGILLSGGETQRLMLARALYRDAPILLLDEPTAALDPLAENEIYMKYGEMTKGKTSLFISHRLASTRFCDRIVFMAEGNIAEEGTHERLVAVGGRYAEVFEVQSRYYREGREF